MKKNLFIILIVVISLSLSAWIDPPTRPDCDKFHNAESGWMYMGETESTCIYYVNGENYETVK